MVLGMKALFLCAGYGKRLYPLTRDRPKALLPLGGVPLLERLMDNALDCEQFDKLYIVTNHRFVQQIYSWLRDYESSRGGPKPIEIFDDNTTTNENRLGAIGDIAFVIRNAKIDDDLMIVAGDNLILFDLGEVARAGREKRLMIAVKDIKNRDLARLYGVVTTDQSGRVIGFEEKPPSPSSSLISIGLYYLGREHLALVDRYLKEGHNRDAPGFFIQWLQEVACVYAYVIHQQWFDIGDIESYNEANRMFGA